MLMIINSIIDKMSIKVNRKLLSCNWNETFHHSATDNFIFWSQAVIIIEPVHEISNNVVCATSKASDQPAHMRSLIRAFASRLSIL